ncbi:unnamed protein product [Vitrella brassicaformis CCMP3155]|uniref:Uncharacterized protein n=2 Tax=Vitrella brassicaformis TaxID=1169539 RepID=A0A0G4FKP3_VITBC|nr:unnamed protein product [Vitrella brassicaformis CCMP3155]|eukprot:CEM13895.1 unnamed protein product [Vitrella brassicaformis CCMP3155]
MASRSAVITVVFAHIALCGTAAGEAIYDNQGLGNGYAGACEGKKCAIGGELSVKEGPEMGSLCYLPLGKQAKAYKNEDGMDLEFGAEVLCSYSQYRFSDFPKEGRPACVFYSTTTGDQHVIVGTKMIFMKDAEKLDYPECGFQL